jgi:FixJ family two-component response regulator
MTTRRILFVDDEPMLLETMARLLERDYEVTTAVGPAAGLVEVEQNGPFALVVSDLRMPGMSGIAFLSRVREMAPDTVRVILTGCGDLEAAISAVNEGQIFRFLTKPCPYEQMISTLDTCIEQHRLVRAEKELLEGTLSGSIQVLSEILALVNPEAFGQASRLRRYLRHMAQALQLKDTWQFELAGMLSQIGCVAISPEILRKIWSGANLSKEEEEMLASHPAVGRTLLAKIPRMDQTARMIGRQRTPPPPENAPLEEGDTPSVVLGGAMLLSAIELDKRLAQGQTVEQALTGMSRKPDLYPPRLLRALEGLQPIGQDWVPRLVGVRQLETFMVLDEDVRARNGMLLAPKGHEVTTPLILRLRSFVLGVGVVEPFRVLMPGDAEMRVAA